jgi:predicted 2-oxoglutarate/Fe(II)-dependent dioxygenase YbiX|tara:strand:+ start:1445 stop:2038 length:594 start_codon:yes stop_codon:yes gene_type:complete
MNSILIVVILVTLVTYLLPKYPDPTVIKNLMNESERRYIIQEASNKLETSMISRDKLINESIRKSETAWLNKEDPVVKSIIHRCLKYTDRPFDNCEKLQVVRYKPGGHYKPHQDAFKDDKNMRLYTFILALNDGYSGGETVFPTLNKSYKLKAGDALFFDTLNNYDFMTSKALHGGNPVKGGDKWICNLWIRVYPHI